MAGWQTPKVSDTASEKWETKTARNARLIAEGKTKGCGSPALPAQAEMAGWNTPRATDGTNGGPNQAGGALPADAAMSGWPTPMSNNSTGAGTQGRQGGENLQTPAQLAGWPTPNAVNGDRAAYADFDKLMARKAAGRQQNLQEVVMTAGWPTPATTDHKGGYQGGRIRDGKLSTDRLDVTAQIAGWNTPAASDGNGGKRPHPDTTMTGQHPEGRKVNMGLASQVHIGFIKTEPARLTATGELLTGSTAGMESGGQLNPAHSRWLMGLPPEWDACAPTATQSSRKSRQK